MAASRPSPATNQPSPPTPLELEAHRPHLLKFALLQLRDTALAEDIVQDTLLAAITGAARFAGQSSVRTWLIGILKHKVIDHFRRARRETRLEDQASASGEFSTYDMDALFVDNGHYVDPPGPWVRPDAALDEKKFFEALERCLRGLPANTARAFAMREVMGMETDEICKEMAISASNCWVLLYRARMALRACLEQGWFAGEPARAG